MSIFRDFFDRYPFQSVLLVLALLLGGMANLVGISAALPAIQIVAEDTAPEERGELEQTLLGVFESVGIAPELESLLLLLVLAILLKNSLLFLVNLKIGYISADVSTSLRMQLLSAVLRSRWRYFAGESPGKLANAMSTESFRASRAYVMGVRVIALGIESLVYAAIAITVSWQATLAAIVASAVILLLSRGLVAISRDGGIRQTHWYRELLSSLTDILQSVKNFKAMGREDLAEGVLAPETEELRQGLRREEFGTAALESVQEPLYTVVLVIGIWAGVMQFGMNFSTVLFLGGVVFQLLKQVGKVQKQYQRLQAFESAYWAMLGTIADVEREREPLPGARETHLEHDIRLEGVRFAYGANTVLDDVSLTIEAGRMTCLIGGSGSGKTTITDLVMGLTRPDAGRVLVDGVDLEEIDLLGWRREIGYVPQENLLLHASVRRNVTLGDATISDEEVERALRSAEAWDFVAAMPEGLDAVLGERGTRISSGQRQRIMIARALLMHPRLLILDEATSALDPDSDRAIAATLRALAGELTVVIVAHHSALTAMADCVYRVEQGRVTRD